MYAIDKGKDGGRLTFTIQTISPVMAPHSLLRAFPQVIVLVVASKVPLEFAVFCPADDPVIGVPKLFTVKPSGKSSTIPSTQLLPQSISKEKVKSTVPTSADAIALAVMVDPEQSKTDDPFKRILPTESGNAVSFHRPSTSR